ncbi:MAG: hypothetical protein WD830_02035 [Chloroflexota bacterium]
MRNKIPAVGILAAALLIAACASTPSATPETISLSTQPPPQSEGCDQALGHGRLVPDPRSGLAIAGSDGTAQPVMWPFGFSAVLDDASRIVLLNENGQPIAREGDTVEFGGGLGLNNFFWVCPAEVRVVARAQ